MLKNQGSTPRPSSFHFSSICRISAIAIFAGAFTFAAAAQQPAPQLVAAATEKPIDLAAVAGVTYSSSTSDVASPASMADADRLNLDAGLQPPPRRRYGRPRYNDNQHNPDGSPKYTFVVGAGMTAPVGNTFHYLNTNYAIQAGGGRNFNKNFGVLLQFDYDAFGFNARSLTNQTAIYNYIYGAGSVSGLDGKSHLWSFTLNPIYNVFSGEKVGGYVVGGVGFFHKTANFTVPGTGTYCDPYIGYCYNYSANETFDKYTSNAPGFDGGIGLTYKASRFSNERIFVEARYVFVDNQHKAGFTVNNYTQITATSTNFYPANSNRTTYTVYKAGIRF
jgi:hypothetical protein